MSEIANDNGQIRLVRKSKAPKHDRLERLARTLELDEAYKVLRKLKPIERLPAPIEENLSVLIVVDCETTGLLIPGTQPPGEAASECIALSMIALAFRPETGEIAGLLDVFDRLRQPSFPIPEASIKVHGITDVMVEGKTISNEEIALWIASMAALCHGTTPGDPLCVAANAAFDRPILEAHYDVFTMLPWACSQTQIRWTDFGFEGTKLSYLATEAGFFYQRHKALDDCWAVAALLRRRCGEKTALAHLIDAAHRPVVRITAAGAPYDARHVLKQRGYRWILDKSHGRKAWTIEVPKIEEEVELAFLRENVLPSAMDPVVTAIDAYRRFSLEPQLIS